MSGDKIKSMRTHAGLSQHELARQVGVSQGLLSLFELGYKTPTDIQMAAIKQAVMSAIRAKSAQLAAIAQDLTA